MTPEPALSILHVAQPVDAGVARHVADLARDQVDREWMVTVACPPFGDLPEWIAETGARAVAWRASRSPGPDVPAESARLARLVRAASPDLVHLHSSKAGLAGRIAIRGRAPTVFQPHAWSFLAVDGILRWGALRWERFAARWTDVLVCVSDAELAEGERRGVRARYCLIRNGVDLSRYPEPSDEDRRKARATLLEDGDPTVVCVGRISRQKGQDVLLDAWPSIVREVPGARLVLVGDGPDRGRLEARALPGVSFVGNRRDVGEWLIAADVVVVPSRWEGMSLVVLEAMASARSVVATDVAGAREMLGDAGAVVPVGSADAIARAATPRLLGPARAEAEGRKARRRVEIAFDLTRTMDETAHLYRLVLERRRERTGMR